MHVWIIITLILRHRQPNFTTCLNKILLLYLEILVGNKTNFTHNEKILLNKLTIKQSSSITETQVSKK